MPITRLLWIGPARGFAASLAEDARFDIRWEPRGPERADGCDLIALDTAAEGAGAWLANACDGAPPCLVWGAEAGREAEWRARGAAAVCTREADPDRLAEALLALRAGESGDDAPEHGPIAHSPALREALARARRAANSRATVLVLGETGTGKEVIARAIHAAGPRAARPFVAINCAALPDTLLESELFGHVRGAFTGADRERRGAFEEAHTGSLFLDEIGETSPAFQTKLLRVLQERLVRPLGSARASAVDVRVIAATHRDLRRDVAAGRFREDLFYRLHVFPIHLAPLRERPEDVLPLAAHFLARHGAEEGKPGCRLSPAAARRLCARPWPGNVRELENEIQRALVSARPGAVLRAEDFADPAPAPPPPPAVRRADATSDGPLQESLARVEAWLIRDALDRHGGRRSDTARKLGLTREGLYKKMKRLGIE